MKRYLNLAAAAGGILFFAAVLPQGACDAPGMHQAEAAIRGTALQPELTGSAYFQEKEGELEIRVLVENAPPGEHGMHIHEYGSCDEDAKAAGGHFDPAGSSHGYLPTDGFKGAHAGDLGNITVREDGTGERSLSVEGLTIMPGKFSILDRSIMIHEKEDTFGQPAGNAGGRIGCGVIRRQAQDVP